ncbi:Kunitz/Bovine pancreatic trypsin inhibitor domain protein [Ancylostoma duodenale]|uniref:Kunitz/Bovine pancreatic trypsin inhibitor domain protein n=1 Tax=Ancylostoma duodenale TaxID=51022 RepID=A0A0C2GK67_9BILA|nr:Kunitz/Bovine pancreatic trypsin inhibitor domain protein [Ancylostoma duodenale]
MRFLLLTLLCVTLCYCRYYGQGGQSKGQQNIDNQQVVQIPTLPPFKKRCTGPAVRPGKVSCLGYFTRYTYKNGRCEEIVYGGCGKTSNNFETREECEETCMGKGSAKYPNSYYRS